MFASTLLFDPKNSNELSALHYQYKTLNLLSQINQFQIIWNSFDQYLVSNTQNFLNLVQMRNNLNLYLNFKNKITSTFEPQSITKFVFSKLT